MPALRKPHRVGVLAADVALDGADAAYAREAGLLAWVACIEACQRHAGLAVYDAESTPLVSLDGHFAPERARPGATPTDAFYGPTRRDELIWLEVKAGTVRLRTVARDGSAEVFDAVGKNVGEQLQQVLNAWLAARGLGALPKKVEAATAEELLGVVRTIGAPLASAAAGAAKAGGGAWAAPVDDELDLDLDDDTEDARASTEGALYDADALAAFDAETKTGFDAKTALAGADLGGFDAKTSPSADAKTASDARQPCRALAARLPTAWRAAALRLLSLAYREDLHDLVLAADPEQPQALFAQYLTAPARDPSLLRRVIAAAPCWARPYAELAPGSGPDAPTALDAVAGAGIAALCRPGHPDVLAQAAHRLHADGRVDEGIRLLERAVAQHDHDPRTHAALVQLHARTDRPGARLAEAQRSAAAHGCAPDAPWYPDQIQVELLVADALLAVGRLDDAIALRAKLLAGREEAWPRGAKLLAAWRGDARLAARSSARAAALRGDPARVLDGFARAEPADAIDVALFLDALVAMGREAEAPLAWAHLGLGAQHASPRARLAAVRGLAAAGEWRRALEELWRVSLCEPIRDEHAAIARAGALLAVMPLDVAESALAERMTIGATTLARRMARDVADFAPGAVKSSIVQRALGAQPKLAFEPAWLDAFPADAPSRGALDALFADALGKDVKHDERVRADRLVNHWFEVAFAEASEADPPALAQAAAYAAAQALGRYLAAACAAPSPLAGALRTVAAEALALVAHHRAALPDRAARALLGALDPLLRRADRWLGTTWLGAVERACGIDERAGGDVAGFAGAHATVAARILGPEEAAVLAASIARLHRERPERWAAAVAAQAGQLALHTGFAGVDEWADAVAAQLAARELELDDALDALHTACYLAEGKSAVPHLHAARALFGAGRPPAAFAVLCAGLGAATTAQRDAAFAPGAPLAEAWARAKLDVPLAAAELAAQMADALDKGDTARAEKLGRFAAAFEPSSSEAHRNLGLALAQQGKPLDALAHLARAAPEQAAQLLAGVLYQRGKLPEAIAVLDYASRWYARAEQWLAFGGIAYAATDNARTAKAYGAAYALDPAAFDATQLNAFAGVLDEIGDYARAEVVAKQLLDAAGRDPLWLTSAWNHLACAYIGQGRFAEAVELAERAVRENKLADHTAAFATTFTRAKTKTQATPKPVELRDVPRAQVHALMASGDFAAAAALGAGADWRVRRGALDAARHRKGAHATAVAAASVVLAQTVAATDREALLARATALLVREQAYFARDPVAPLGEPAAAAPPAPFVDRVVLPGGKVARVNDYIALLRDLAALPPREAIAQFDLDDAGYLELAKQWAAAIDADPSLAQTIAAGLAKR